MTTISCGGHQSGLSLLSALEWPIHPVDAQRAGSIPSWVALNQTWLRPWSTPPTMGVMGGGGAHPQ